MKKSNFSKSGLFLIEFMIVLLFFSISAVVCVSLFVQADQMNKHTSEENKALFLVQSTAEQIKASGLTGFTKTDSEEPIVSYYDKQWNLVSEKDNPKYKMTIDAQVQEKILEAQIYVTKGERELFRLTVKDYNPKK